LKKTASVKVKPALPPRMMAAQQLESQKHWKSVLVSRSLGPAVQAGATLPRHQELPVPRAWQSDRLVPGVCC
jgi:hypothetical protein